MIATIRPHHAQPLVVRQRAAAHHVGRYHLGLQHLVRQAVDGLPGRVPRAVAARHFMHRRDALGASRELDLGHGEQRAPHAIPHVLRDRIVEHRRAGAGQRDGAAHGLGMEAVAQQRQHALQVGELAHHVRMAGAETGHGGRQQQRMQRRRLQLVADGPVDGVRVQEMVRVHRLRRARIAIHALLEQAGRDQGGMEEGALAQQAVGIGRPRAHQQRRRIDGAARQDEVFGAQRHLAARGRQARLVQRHAIELFDPPALEHEALRAQAREQHGAALEGRRQGRHQHRLLGVGGTAHAAVTEIPATVHVAVDGGRGHAQLGRALAQQVVVGVGGRAPLVDAEPLFHHAKPGRQRLRRIAFQAEVLAPVIERAGRGAKAGGPVDDGGAAHGAPLQDVDALVARLARARFLVQGGIGVRLAHLEVPGRLERALFHDQHLEPGQREDLGRHAAAGAAADDDHIRFQRTVALDAGAVGDVPAGGQAGLDGIGNGARGGRDGDIRFDHYNFQKSGGRFSAIP